MSNPEFIEAVMEVVSLIPEGHVMTYGDIAWVIGSNAPRAVGKVMAHYGHSVTWWRVVGSSGKPPQHHSAQALPYYLEEGTPLRGNPAPGEYRIAMAAARLTHDHEIYADSEIAP